MGKLINILIAPKAQSYIICATSFQNLDFSPRFETPRGTPINAHSLFGVACEY